MISSTSDRSPISPCLVGKNTLQMFFEFFCFFVFQIYLQVFFPVGVVLKLRTGINAFILCTKFVQIMNCILTEKKTMIS